MFESVEYRCVLFSKPVLWEVDCNRWVKRKVLPTFILPGNKRYRSVGILGLRLWSDLHDRPRP